MILTEPILLSAAECIESNHNLLNNKSSYGIIIGPLIEGTGGAFPHISTGTRLYKCAAGSRGSATAWSGVCMKVTIPGVSAMSTSSGFTPSGSVHRKWCRRCPSIEATRLIPSCAPALLNLSLAEANRAAIAGAPGGIKGLVHALRTGTAAAKQNAACALLSLAMAEEHRAAVGASGAVPALVALMVGGSSRGKKDALTALYKLCALRRNKERAVSAGAAGPLVRMVAERGGGTAEKAMVVLASLAGVPEGSEAIVAAGGVAALVEAVEDGPARGRELAVYALLQLCADCPQNRALLVREGAIPPLVALSQSASSARVKHKAGKLLGYLREQPQEGGEAAVAAAPAPS